VPDRPPLRVAVAVGLVAACTLAMQVLLTRLFSAALFYHFAFFAISLALLGTGAGALLVYTRPGWFERRRPQAALARWSILLALLLIAVPAVLVRLDYSSSITVTFGLVVTLAVAGALSALPLLAAGIVIVLAIRTYVGSVGRVYAFDLAGAALGALVVVPLLRLESAPTLLVALGAVAGIAAALFGWPSSAERQWGAGVAALSVLATVLAASTSLYDLPPPFAHSFRSRVAGDRWTPISRVVGYWPVGTLGASLTYDQDFAPVPFHRRGTPPPGWRALELGPESIGYALTGPGHALVIGGGGGRDIYNALSARQRVDVIELNQGIVDVVDRDMRRYSGAPYTLPGVSTAVGDGRSTLAARSTKYDTIHIGFTNTLSANLGAAYALSENNLYTVEAFDEYLDHLRPGGILSISRPYRFTGEEALRTTVMALEVLRKRGVSHPERNVIVILGGTRVGLAGTVLIRLRPYTARDLVLVRRLARERSGGRPAGVAFAPGGPNRFEWRRLAAARDPLRFCEHYRSNVCPSTDDKPFFLNPTRLQDVFHAAPPGATYLTRAPFFLMLAVLGIVLVLSVLAFALPLRLVRTASRPRASSLVYFAAIGLGYLTLEIVLIQRFVLLLGFPTYALSIVLFALLLFTGAGSLLSARWRDPRGALIRSLVAVCVLLAAFAVGLEPLIHALIGKPFALRVAVAIATLAPAGVGLGMAMPIGLRRLAALYPGGVAWAWAINGFTSVLASVLALLVAISWGFEATTLLALGCYLVALAHAVTGRWPPRAAVPKAGAASG